MQTDWKQEIFKRLDILAEKLGTTAAYLWHVLVKQGIVEGITDCIVALIFLISAIIGFKLLKYALKNGPKHCSKLSNGTEGDWEALYCYSAGFGGVLILVGVIGFTYWIYIGLQALLNPEFYALQKLFESLK